MKQISVILPTYNRAYCIRRAVDSVLCQTWSHWELLVVDDGSTDNTEEIIAAYAASDERVRYCRKARNQGVSAARNEGIRLARHEYIAFQDSDDVWHADKLEKQMRIFENQPELGLVYCAMQGTRQDGSAVRVPDISIDRRLLQGNLYGLLLQGNVIDAPTAVMRKSCVEKCGGFDEGLSCLEDWELFLRIARDYEIGYADEALVDSDIHNHGVSGHAGGYFEARCKMIAMHRTALLEYGLFDRVVEQMLLKAKAAGVLEPVSKILQNML